MLHRWAVPLLVGEEFRRWAVCLHRWAYIQPDPGRRAGASLLRAAGVSRLNEGFRDFSKVEIALSINYLRSPLGWYKPNSFLYNQLVISIL